MIAILQHAWVVPDLEAACRQWHTQLGVGPFLLNRHIRLDSPRHRGVPAVTDFSTAIAQHGDIQIELIEQHDDSPSAYRETVAAGRMGFHHVGYIPHDYDAELERLSELSTAADGRFGDLRFAYLDASAALGHMIELIEDRPSIRAYFQSIRDAAAGWDGDPATLIRG